jgi:hypothetical protein
VLRWMQQAEIERRLRAERATHRPTGAPPRAQRVRTTDTIACSRCGTYVPSEFPTACDRRDCPFPGVG